jgi:protein disulfide-isomerase A6
VKGNKINIGKVDATVHPKFAQKYGVSGYPTLKFFPPGAKNEKDIIPYNGPRDASSMESWVKDMSDKGKPIVVN